MRSNRKLASPLVLAIVILCSVVGAHAQLVSSVDAVGMTVSNMDRAVDFYSRVLTFEKISEAELSGPEFERLVGVFGARAKVVRMKLGKETIELTEYLAPQSRPIPDDARSNDQSFQHIAIIVTNMDQAYNRLREFHVAHASTGPQQLPEWNKNAAGIQAFYFKDPDGHPLEILHFPDDKGSAVWHRPAKGILFLGIDHTAIVTTNTERSLQFYRDLLGMRIVGESENYGIEQEHLNNVFGARLRITSLRAANGVGIELLEYLAPADGRPFPQDEQASDLLHRYTALRAADVAGVDRALVHAHSRFISPGVQSAENDRRGLTVRDPDGHVLEIRANQ